MTRDPLSEFQIQILLLAEAGLSNRQIAAQVERPFACIITTFSNIKRKGYQLPDHRPRDATAERAHQVRKRRDCNRSIIFPRFTAAGVKASTGERFEVTSDSQEFSDGQLAALLGERAPIISRTSETFTKAYHPGGVGPRRSYGKKAPIDHGDVFRMHADGMKPTAIGARLGVSRWTISRILRKGG